MAADERRRVVVTGLGMITPLGVGRESFAEKLFAGACGISPIETFDTQALSAHQGGEVSGFSPRDFVSVKSLRRMDRLSLMTTAAARLSLEDAGIVVDAANRDRIGIILGTAFGPTDVTTQLVGTLVTKGAQWVNPISVPNSVMNAPAGHASIELGFRGVNTTVTHYAVSAEMAVAIAVSEIRRGAADCILAGGADILSPFYYETLGHFHALSPQGGGQEACRPFDRGRNGIIAGEGCGLLCLESWESACTGGREPYCEITGIGMGSSPAPPTDWPASPEGLKKTLSRALKDTGLAPGEIQAVSAAANGSRLLDEMEAEAYAAVFGGAEAGPAITSLKGAIGESFSGGGMRASALILSMRKAMLPPTVGLTDPVRPLRFVRGASLPASINHALLTGVSFGGTYAHLIFSRFNPKEGHL